MICVFTLRTTTLPWNWQRQKASLVLLTLKSILVNVPLLNLSRKARVRRKRRRTSPSKKVIKLPQGLLIKERNSKENVSIVVRKDIGRGIVQYLRLPRMRVRKINSFLKYVWYRIPLIPGVWIQVVLIISAIPCRVLGDQKA